MVDTLASGASARKGVEVQVLSWAPSVQDELQISPPLEKKVHLTRVAVNPANPKHQRAIDKILCINSRLIMLLSMYLILRGPSANSPP